MTGLVFEKRISWIAPAELMATYANTGGCQTCEANCRCMSGCIGVVVDGAYDGRMLALTRDSGVLGGSGSGTGGGGGGGGGEGGGGGSGSG